VLGLSAVAACEDEKTHAECEQHADKMAECAGLADNAEYVNGIENNCEDGWGSTVYECILDCDREGPCDDYTDCFYGCDQ